MKLPMVYITKCQMITGIEYPKRTVHSQLHMVVDGSQLPIDVITTEV